jgi:mRNA interferase MazF
VPLTTARATIRFPGTHLIQPSAANGLLRRSVALVFQLRAIDRRRIAERLGSIEEGDLQAKLSELDQLCGRN